MRLRLLWSRLGQGWWVSRGSQAAVAVDGSGSSWMDPALVRRLLLALVPAGLLLALVILPLQGLAIAGYTIQAQWHRGTPGLVDPLLPVVVFAMTLTLLALAWGPLAAGRGSGLLAVAVLQDPLLAEPELRRQEAALNWRVQFLRLPLLALTHLAGLGVGIETPAASLAATTLLALRSRLLPLQAVPLPLLVAVGAGAGLGAAFRSPLLGVTYALECLGAASGLPLVLPTVLLAGIASLLSTDLAVPSRLSAPLIGALPPLMLPWALLLTLLAASVGTGLRAALLWLTPRVDQLLQRRFLPTALVLAALITALAHLSGGISLNDGALDLGPALAGHPAADRWALLPRLFSPVLAVLTGAPGGLPQDCMTLGALLVAPLVRRLASDQQAILIAIGAAVVFSSACRTPLLAAVFVFVLQRHGESLPLLLIASALGAALGVACGGPRPWPGQLIHSLPLPSPEVRISANRPSDGGG